MVPGILIVWVQAGWGWGSDQNPGIQEQRLFTFCEDLLNNSVYDFPSHGMRRQSDTIFHDHLHPTPPPHSPQQHGKSSERNLVPPVEVWVTYTKPYPTVSQGHLYKSKSNHEPTQYASPSEEWHRPPHVIKSIDHRVFQSVSFSSGRNRRRISFFFFSPLIFYLFIFFVYLYFGIRLIVFTLSVCLLFCSFPFSLLLDHNFLFFLIRLTLNK